DIDDPRIAIFHAIKERDRIGRDGVFIAEGLSVLNVLLTRSRLQTLAILIEESRIPRLPVLAHCGDAPLYSAPQTVLDAIAGFHLHRGILAAGRIPPCASLADLPPGHVRVPVCVTLANHDNVGGIFRNAAAFGAPAVVIDTQTADPFYRKAIRVGVGAPLLIPTVRLATDELLAALATASLTPVALTPSADETLDSRPLPPRAAFLLGPEGPGLPQSLIAAAEPRRIAMAPGWDSLNVATTAALALSAHATAYDVA
ncbi:MAG: RNA methyltransferase, partial [Pseudomonadota bacterium]